MAFSEQWKLERAFRKPVIILAVPFVAASGAEITHFTFNGSML